MRDIVRNRILKKCNNKCVKCGSIERLEVDHIIPLSVGGREDEDNMQILCRSCNAKKHNTAEYKGIIKLDDNFNDYILLNRKKGLQIICSREKWEPFYKHFMEVMEHPEKYLPIYGEKNG